MKKLQNKILLIFFIIGTIIIIGMGVFFAGIIGESQEFIGGSEYVTSHDLINIANTQMNQAKILILGTILVFSCIVIVVGIFISEAIVKPLNKMIINAQKLTNGESVELIELNPKRKRKKKTELDSIINIISIMNVEMNQKLNEVNRQKREIEAILLHMNDGIVAFDEKGNIMHINPAAKALLKIDKESNFEEIFSRFNANIKMDAILYLDNTAEEKIAIEDKTINVFLASYKDENDLSSGIIAVVQDITEHVKLDDMRKEFVADVSHELKTPITSIIGYADTLQDGDYDKETQQRFLSVISSEGRRMADLVSDLLTLSRYDTNRMTRELTIFDLGEVAKKCQEKLAIEIEKKKQNVECYVTADVPPIEADKNGIERVILNVLSNAVKYTQEEGNIKIYVGFVYNDAYIKVIDNGIGIPKDDLSRVFERFYRVDKARSREMGGTGLGLSIAKEIIEQNNGSIDIKSELGKGTEVVIRIPAVKKA